MGDRARVLDDADDETARLIISMQMEDIKAAASATQAGDIEQQLFDAEVARQLVETDLKD